MPQPPTLVIGYGNDLRGDDAAGRLVAEVIAGMGMPGVTALSLPQLAPELAERLAQVRAAIFVDARLDDEDDSVQVRPLVPADATTTFGHSGSPAWLLALAERLYGQRPQAWLVTVPAQRFELGEEISERARRRCYAAIQEVQRLVGATAEPQV